MSFSLAVSSVRCHARTLVSPIVALSSSLPNLTAAPIVSTPAASFHSLSPSLPTLSSLSSSSCSLSLLSSSSRSFGIFSGLTETFRNRLESRHLEANKENFTSFIGTLAGLKHYSLFHYKEFMSATAKTAGMDSWKAKVTGNENKPEFQQLRQTLAVLDCIPNLLLHQPERISADDKQGIARLAKTTVTEVNRVIADYQRLRSLHRWIRFRADSGKDLPMNQEEMKEQIYDSMEDYRKTQGSGGFNKREFKRPKANFNDPTY